MVTQLVAGRVYEYSRSVGRGGAGLGFSLAVASVVGQEDRVYVLSRGSESLTNVPWNRTGRGSRVGILTIGTEPDDEEFVSEFGKYGDAEGEFIWPAGLALDSRENIYVTDEWLNRVSVFDKEGNTLAVWGSGGEGDGELQGPSGIAIDSQDNLYIVDSRNHRVQKFSSDGAFLSKWGSFGSDGGRFDSPWGITIDDAGYIYVADHKNHRVEKFTAEGDFVAQFGSFGVGRGQLKFPSDVAVDPDGEVYVCDWANSRVQIFDANGKYIANFIGDAQELTKWSKMIVDASPETLKRRREVRSMEPEWRFALPRGVTFDSEKGRLLVSDSQRNRIQIYNKLKDYSEPQRNL
jgi:DNA-binding beta-propeller fold protein YncE